MEMKKAQLQAVKGMGDIFPPESGKWRRLEALASAVAERYGFNEIRIPIVEPAELFARGLGDSSDIVQKEMFVFSDAGGKNLALRPEGTAGVVRAFIEKKLSAAGGPAKFYYLGPMFRRERPQAGRRRQFNQFGTEALGSSDPALDAETIDLLTTFLAAAGVKDYTLALNSVGCFKCRPPYQRELDSFLKSRRAALCPNCRRRLESNVLRVLDCKNPACRRVVAEAPVIVDRLCSDCGAHFAEVRRRLEALSIPARLDPCLVRGLDYYTRTVFEVFSPALGAQDALAAGGRYDDLVESLGGDSTPAVGFSAGLERVLLAALAPAGTLPPSSGGIYLVSLGEESFDANFVLLSSLRREGLRAEIDYGRRSLKAQMRSADKFGACWALIRGKEEMGRGMVKIKDLDGGREEEVAAAVVLSTILQK